MRIPVISRCWKRCKQSSDFISGEEAKTAAEEMTGIGKTVARMVREIKNKGLQY
jgi:hypothetical protein